ncbi:MAG: RNA polymerase sigma factor [Bacteroidota bacterium]
MTDKPEDSICEEQVFENVFYQYSTLLRNYAYYNCGDTAQADDLVQKAFIKLWENCAKVPLKNVKAFIYKVARNYFLKDVAKKKVRLEYKKQHKPGAVVESPQFVLEEKEFEKQLNDAIANLSEKQREVFLLHKIEKKKYQEIAQMLDISVKAVEKRMHMALVHLRKEIKYFDKKR